MLCSVPTPIVPLIKKVCAVSPLMLRSVPTQIDPINKKVCAVSPQMLFGVHTPIVPLIKTVCAVSLLPVYILCVRCSLHPNVIYAFVTLGSVLDSKQSRKSGKFQLARWSLLGPSIHPPTAELFVVRCPTQIVLPINKVCAVSHIPVYVFRNPNCSPNQKSECSPPHIGFFWALSPPLCLGNLSTLILGLGWIINLTQLVSRTVALPAELASLDYLAGPTSYARKLKFDIDIQ